MNKEPLNIVWLQRDFKSQDHRLLFKAGLSGIPYRIIYLCEHSLVEYSITSPRYLQFIYLSILTLNRILAPFNRRVAILCINYSHGLPFPNREITRRPGLTRDKIWDTKSVFLY